MGGRGAKGAREWHQHCVDWLSLQGGASCCSDPLALRHLLMCVGGQADGDEVVPSLAAGVDGEPARAG